MRTVLFIFMITLFFSCNQQGENTAQLESQSLQQPASYKGESMREMDDQAAQEQVVDEKKLIRKAYLEMEVNDYEKAKEEIDAIIEAAGGTIEREEERSSSYRLEANMTIRVVPEKLDELVEQLAGLARNVDRKTIETEDVTRQYIDLETRLKSKRAIVDRYQELLQQARNVEEILKVEENLRKVTEEIESTEAQLRYLSRQIDKSTLHLTYYQPVERITSTGPSFGKKIIGALQGGWQFLLNAILFFIQIWPLTILAIVGIVLLIRRRRRLAGK